MVNTGRGLAVKRPGVLRKVQMLNLVLGVGVFSFLHTILARGDHPNSRKKAPRMKRQMKIFHVGAHQFRESLRSCSENCGFRIAQVVRCHSENGICHSDESASRALVIVL